jgi:hypothetical protein
VIRFAVRLAVSGGREAVGRLAVIAVAVAIGVGLLLTALAGMNAVSAQNARYSWMNSGLVQAGTSASDADPVLWRLSEDYFAGHPIARVDVAATGPHAPVPPGLARLPGPGEYYASPALRQLIAATPADQLGARFPGRLVGDVGRAALPAPNSLVVVVGYAPDQLAALGGKPVTRIVAVAPQDCFGCAAGVNANGMALILGVVVGALLFPLLIFIATATRLSAARREQRFAAMRLIGATPRQVSLIATVESTVATLAGTVAGFGLFYAFRHPLAGIPFTGEPFFPADLRLGPLAMVLVLLGVPAAAALAARLALRRVRISPLGVSRRVTPGPPRAYRLIPLVVGLAELAWFGHPAFARSLLWVTGGLVRDPGSVWGAVVEGRIPSTSTAQLAIFLPGFLVTMAGLVIAGPWFTRVGARALARRSRRPATLIAARRLGDNPQAGFRAVSGLVLALFVTSVAVGVIGTVVANRGTHPTGQAGRDILTAHPVRGDDPLTALPGTLGADLSAVPGVHALVTVRRNPELNMSDPYSRDGLVRCADLTGPDLRRCPDGMEVAQVWLGELGAVEGNRYVEPMIGSPVSAARLDSLPILSIEVDTDGSTAALERARTVLENAFPGGDWPPATDEDFDSDFTRLLTAWQQLANVVILATLPIAGCSLAVAVVGGLSERRRPFSLLRLTGAPLRVLRRVVALESVVPLLIVAVVATGTGLLAAQLFLRAQMDYALRPPGAAYWALVLAGLVGSLAIIAATLPVLERITGPENARNG